MQMCHNADTLSVENLRNRDTWREQEETSVDREHRSRVVRAQLNIATISNRSQCWRRQFRFVLVTFWDHRAHKPCGNRT